MLIVNADPLEKKIIDPCKHLLVDFRALSTHISIER